MKTIKYLIFSAICFACIFALCACTSSFYLSNRGTNSTSIASSTSYHSYSICSTATTVKLDDTANVVGSGTYEEVMYNSASKYVVNVISLFKISTNGKVETIDETGTGIIINRSGYVLTSVSKVYYTTFAGSKIAASKIYVALNSPYDNTVLYEMSVVNSNSATGLAVLKFVNAFTYVGENAQTQSGFKNYAVFDDSDDLQVGSPCSFVADITFDTSTILQLYITSGIVSDVSGTIESVSYNSKNYPLIQTTASMNSGGGGGALINSKGYVVGIGYSKLTSYNKMSYSLPSRLVYDYICSLNASENSIALYLADGFGGDNNV